MQVVVHPSPLVLEEELCRRIAAAKAGDPWAAVLVVVPSRRLALHVARRLVERFGSVLGVEILHHVALAERIVDAAGAVRPRVVHDAILETLLASVVRKAPRGPLRDFVRDHPGAAAALGNTFAELREAGIEPAAAREGVADAHAELAALYARWSAELDALRAKGATDAAGLAREAVPHAAAFASRFRAVIHHGAYDLIGVRVDLVRALDAGREVAFLLPAHPTELAGSFGVARARAIAGPGAPWHPLDGLPPTAAASFFHTQGAVAELETAAREALAAVAAGIPPHEVAIVVRSFAPYAAAMDALLDAGGPRWHTSYQRPLRREPAVAAAWRAIAEAPAGADAPYAAHAASFAALARDAMGDEGWSAPAGLAIAKLLGALREVETLLGETGPVPRDEALAWLEAHLDGAVLPPDGADGAGIRVLDAMQARALTFRHLAVAGMNSGVFPRIGRDDPFLPDAARERLAAATGRPLPLASESDGEERLLLAMLMGATSERVSISWRRADDAGRPVVPSLALRDVARALGAGTDAASLERAARALPAHPRSRLEAWARDPGLLRPDEEALAVALESEVSAAAGPALSARRSDLSAGVALIAATDSFAPGDGAYDGRVGRGVARTTLAATAIERLGACPLRFFFRDVLHVNAEPEPPTPFEPDFAAVGIRVHEALRDVYAGLLREDAFVKLELSSRIARGGALLRAAWRAQATGEDAARAARYPLLARIDEERWIATLDAFLAADLERMEAQEAVPVALEHTAEKTIPGGPEGLIVKARFDRIVEGANGRVIGDYKTMGRIEDRAKPGPMLTGARLQVPVYALLEGVPVELLGVGPSHAKGPGDDEDPRFVRFEGFKTPEQRGGVLETLRVLAALAAAGRFPLRPGDHCRHCEYAAACRRGHPPTEHREEHAPDVADARDSWEKSDKKPTLADVRAGRPS